MKQLLFSILLLGFLFASRHAVEGQTIFSVGSGNSQILRAYRASGIVVAEVVYVADRQSSRFGTEPVGIQTIVYSIVETIKGKGLGDMINVSVPVFMAKRGDLKQFIVPGQKHILLLGKLFDSGCNDQEVDRTTKLVRTKPEFSKYLKLSCYQIERDSVIDASPEEIKAIRLFR